MKCKKCGSEWSTSTKFDVCPFCSASLKSSDDFSGSFEDMSLCLKYIFEKNGIDIIGKKNLLVSLVSDYMPHHEAEVRLLRTVLEANIFNKFLGISESNIENRRSDAVMILTENYFLSERAAQMATDWIIGAIFESYTAPIKERVYETVSTTATDAVTTPQNNGTAFPDGEYIGEIKAGKRHGFGTMKYTDYYAQAPNICTYEGEWKDDKRHGFGSATFPDGTAYKGSWENGLRCGHGVLYFSTALASGAYNGYWLNDKFHGKGTSYTDKGKKAYEGEWKNGEYDGYGNLFFIGGNVYKGDFSAGKRHGFGTLYSADGTVKYKGYWYKGTKDPDGVKFFSSYRALGEWIFPEGKYHGDLSVDKRHGNGVLTYNEKDSNRRIKYIGQWKDGKRCGWGTLYFSNGDRYEGEFKNDNYHGEGKFIKKSGRYLMATWRNGKLISSVFFNADGKAVRGLIGDFSFQTAK